VGALRRRYASKRGRSPASSRPPKDHSTAHRNMLRRSSARASVDADDSITPSKSSTAAGKGGGRGVPRQRDTGERRHRHIATGNGQRRSAVPTEAIVDHRSAATHLLARSRPRPATPQGRQSSRACPLLGHPQRPACSQPLRTHTHTAHATTRRIQHTAVHHRTSYGPANAARARTQTQHASTTPRSSLPPPPPPPPPKFSGESASAHPPYPARLSSSAATGAPAVHPPPRHPPRPRPAGSPGPAAAAVPAPDRSPPPGSRHRCPSGRLGSAAAPGSWPPPPCESGALWASTVGPGT
jgi:hypothetical protein